MTATELLVIARKGRPEVIYMVWVIPSTKRILTGLSIITEKPTNL